MSALAYCFKFSLYYYGVTLIPIWTLAIMSIEDKAVSDLLKLEAICCFGDDDITPGALTKVDMDGLVDLDGIKLPPIKKLIEQVSKEK